MFEIIIGVAYVFLLAGILIYAAKANPSDW